MTDRATLCRNHVEPGDPVALFFDESPHPYGAARVKAVGKAWISLDNGHRVYGSHGTYRDGDLLIWVRPATSAHLSPSDLAWIERYALPGHDKAQETP